MAFKFPSDEWVKEFGNQINSNKGYEQSAKDWEGDFMFIVEGDDAYPKTVYFFIGLYHGKCTDAAMVDSDDAREAQYSVRGSYSTWRRVIEAKLDPIQAVMMRRLKLKGNLMKVMRYPKAAKDLVDSVSRVDTDFEA